MKVSIVVTHLLGTGHLSRAITLGRAFSQAGHEVQLISGGFPAPHLIATDIMIEQLPPLKSDGVNFTALLDESGEVATGDYLQKRQQQLCRAVTQMQPDILITELFPFGRRSLKHEFLQLLNATKALPNPPCILASIRDILAPPSKPAKAQWADQVIAEFYDAVLVHSDPQATRLEISWPVSEMLAAKLQYTGYVAPPPPKAQQKGAGTGEIIVSAGGGEVGDQIYRCALQAADLMQNHRWRLLVGGAQADARIATFRAEGSRAIIEAARPDFRQLLTHAAVSVSMCGYNTALDLLQANTPAILVPFDAGNEVEQGLRADSLAQLNGLHVIRSNQLTPARLVASVEDLLHAPRRDDSQFDFDGAKRTVDIAETIARRPR